MMQPANKSARVYRVRDINRAIRLRVEQAFSDLYVEGEISDFTQSAAGHLYFTLNDELEAAQLSVVMFRADARRAKLRLTNGQRVKLRGGCSYFEPRGRLQFIARGAEAAGEGDLAARFEALYKKLEAEGLFDPALRRPLPAFPQTIGVVTSSTGAAIRDIIRVAHERMPVRIVIADCRVQGEGALPRSSRRLNPSSAFPISISSSSDVEVAQPRISGPSTMKPSRARSPLAAYQSSPRSDTRSTSPSRIL